METAKILLAAGADPSACNSDGLTPANVAEEKEREEVAAFLKEACPYQNERAVPGLAARRIDETNAHTVHMTMGELAAACGQDGQFCTMECEAQDEGNAKRRKS